MSDQELSQFTLIFLMMILPWIAAGCKNRKFVMFIITFNSLYYPENKADLNLISRLLHVAAFTYLWATDEFFSVDDREENTAIEIYIYIVDTFLFLLCILLFVLDCLFCYVYEKPSQKTLLVVFEENWKFFFSISLFLYFFLLSCYPAALSIDRLFEATMLGSEIHYQIVCFMFFIQGLICLYGPSIIFLVYYCTRDQIRPIRITLFIVAVIVIVNTWIFSIFYTMSLWHLWLALLRYNLINFLLVLLIQYLKAR